MSELDQQPVYLTAAQLSARWCGQVRVTTLANWRTKKKGPPFAKFCGAVMYPLKELREWEKAQMQPANDNQPIEGKADE